MIVLEPTKPGGKCRRGNGVGYCPFPVLGRDIAVVSQQEGPGVHDRRACAHDRGNYVREQVCLRRPVATGFLRCSVAIKDSLSRQRWPTLCCDRDFSVAIGSWAVRAFYNTPKYTLAVFDMFRVFCKRNLNVS